MAEETIVVIVDESGEHEFVINGNLMNEQLAGNGGEIVLQLDTGQNVQFDGTGFLNAESIFEIRDDMLAMKTLGEEYINDDEDETLKGRRISTLLSGPKKYLPASVDEVDYKDFDLIQSTQPLLMKAEPIEDLPINKCEQIIEDFNSTLSVFENISQSTSEKKRISTLPFDENYVLKKEPPLSSSSGKLFSDSFSEFLSRNCEANEKSQNVEDCDLSAVTTTDGLEDEDTDLSQLKSHLDSVPIDVDLSLPENDESHKCDFCDKSFRVALSLELHKMSSHEHNPNLPVHCELCGKSFKHSMSLELHKLSHSELFQGSSHKDYRCPVKMCTFQCPLKSTIRKHVSEVHSVDFIHICSRCKFTGITSKEYTDHLKSDVHRKIITNWTLQKQSACKPFMCSHCGRQLSSKRSLATHKLTHQQSQYSCDLCPYVGSTSYYLSKHKLTHCKDKKYSCSSCSYETYNPDGLKRHIKNKHVQGKPRYSCRVCSVSFPLRSELRVHSMMQHGIADTHFCGQCSFSCKDRAEYKDHLQIHFGAHNHQCELCDYKCNTSHQLRRHMMRHSNEKQFKCSICSSAFYEKTDLQRHMFHHSGVKPFKCPLCEYSCKFKNTLTLHMKTHSDVKGYACTQCDYTSKYHQNLKKHELIHDIRNGKSNIEFYSCDFCDYSTPLKENLKKHSTRMHDYTF